jgi:hypothetical protein
VTSHQFTTDETDMLRLVREEDEVAVVLDLGWGESARRELRQMRVTSLHHDRTMHDGNHYTFVRFIGYDFDGLPHHESYGSTIGCFVRHQLGPTERNGE